MSFGNYIKDSIELIRYIKSEYWDTIGMNAQRYSDIGDNAGKGVTEQAIVRSAIITNELFRQFEMVMCKDYQGLLDLSKTAYINGKKAKYIRTDGSYALLDLNLDDAEKHSSTSYNIFVRPASESTEALQAMRAQAVNLIQNGGDNSVLGALYSTNNPAKLTKLLEKLDENKKQYEALLQKQAEEAQQKLEETRQATENIITEREKYKADSQYQAAVDSAEIRSRDNSRNEPRPSNAVEERLADHKIEYDNKKLENEKDKIQKSSNKN
jgi:hypothetical protein